ncbi:BT1926 family outer membrane beta-barrel protein, partial [Bacteroides fragilis]
WFFKDQWKLNLGGGVSFTNNPGYPAVPGTIDDSNKNNLKSATIIQYTIKGRFMSR